MFRELLQGSPGLGTVLCHHVGSNGAIKDTFARLLCPLGRAFARGSLGILDLEIEVNLRASLSPLWPLS
jgi:hypothetical protein